MIDQSRTRDLTDPQPTSKFGIGRQYKENTETTKFINDPTQGPNRPRVMTKERHTTMGKPQIKHQLTETRGLTDPTS